ncbi:MAG: hypothetical protein U9R47_00220 [Actinomycetota bacterium]|nr:hypothetical protein [Actinomycetota bacterium]
MAATTAHSPANLLVCLGDPLANPGAAVRRNLAASRSDVDRVEDLPQWGIGTVNSGRLPSFTCFAKRREGSISRTASLKGLATTTPLMSRSIEERVM